MYLGKQIKFKYITIKKYQEHNKHILLFFSRVLLFMSAFFLIKNKHANFIIIQAI